MERTLVFICFCVTIECNLVKQYYFISERLTWESAQAYCREHYTDLAFIFNRRDAEQFQQLITADGQFRAGFIGLHKDPDMTDWEWSGGGRVNYTNWASSQPDFFMNRETKGMVWTNGAWNDVQGNISQAFYCVTLSVLEEEAMPWEEAMEHCRRRGSHLVSLHSKADISVAQSAMQRGETDRMWIGLRFLRDDWLWVNGEGLRFQAWSPEAAEDQQCPLWNRCAALTEEGVWQSTDCKESLPFMCI